MWCRRNPLVAGAAGLLTAALMVVAVLSLLYADRQARLAIAERLRADEQTEYSRKQAENTAKISAQAKDLEKQSQDLKTSLAESNRRLAQVFFERAQRSFDGGQVSHGMLWLVETWRYAAKAEDRTWQHLALANLSFRRYGCPEIQWVFPWIVAVSPDGNTILSLSRGDDNAGQLWDVATCRPIGQHMAHEKSPTAAWFSRDGKTIAIRSIDNTMRLWDATTGRPIGVPIEYRNTNFETIDFGPDSKTVLTREPQQRMQLWSAATGRPIGPPIAWSPTSASEFSPDGRTIRILDANGAGQLRDASSGRLIWPPAAHGAVGAALAFSPDGKTVLTAEPSRLVTRLLDVRTGDAVTLPMVHDDSVYMGLFSPDGRTVLTADRRGTTARLWDATTGRPIGLPMIFKYPDNSFTFSPDGRTLAAGSYVSVQLWDATTALPIGPPSQHERLDMRFPTEVSFSSEGATVALRCFFEGNVRLLNAATGLPIGPPLRHQAAVVSVSFSPDGKTILTGSEDNTARLWDAATAQPLGQPMVHESPLDSARFCSNGGSILTRTTDGIARLWVVPTGLQMGQPLESIHTTRNVAFSADGKTVQTNEQGPIKFGAMSGPANHVRLWDTHSGSLINGSAADAGHSIRRPTLHGGGVHLAFDRDGKALPDEGGEDDRALGLPCASADPSTYRASRGLRERVQPRHENHPDERGRPPGAVLGRRDRPAHRSGAGASVRGGARSGQHGSLQSRRHDGRNRR